MRMEVGEEQRNEGDKGGGKKEENKMIVTE